MRMAALGFAFASFSFAAFLGGCTAIPARGPSSEELSAIRSQKAAVVLLRVTATEDGKALNTSAGGGGATLTSVSRPSRSGSKDHSFHGL